MQAEICGSNSSNHAVGNGNAATRTWVVPWASRIAFAESVYGSPHPEIPYCWCNAVAIEPIMAEQVASEPGGVITYPNGHAKITASYATDWAIANHWPADIPKPDFRENTGLTIGVQYAGEWMRVPAREVRWEDNYAGDPDLPLPDDESMCGRIMIQGAHYNLLWKYVDNPPIKRLRGAIGQVNDAPFLGCERGTLLCVGFDLEPSSKASIAEPGSWECPVKFQERTIAVGGVNYGWNHELRADGWHEVVINGEPRYKYADLSGLFE